MITDFWNKLNLYKYFPNHLPHLLRDLLQGALGDSLDGVGVRAQLHESLEAELPHGRWQGVVRGGLLTHFLQEGWLARLLQYLHLRKAFHRFSKSSHVTGSHVTGSHVTGLHGSGSHPMFSPPPPPPSTCGMLLFVWERTIKSFHWH